MKSTIGHAVTIGGGLIVVAAIGFFLAQPLSGYSTKVISTVEISESTTTDNNSEPSVTNPIVVQLTAESSSPTVSSSQSDEQSWLKYTNEAYGFSIMYPPDWILASTDSTDTIIEFPSDSEGITIAITVSSNPDGLDPQRWAQQAWGDYLRTPERTTTVSGAPAFEANAFDYDHEPVLTYLQHGHEMYQIEFDNYDLGLSPTKQSQFKALFQQIVDTFRFN